MKKLTAFLALALVTMPAPSLAVIQAQPVFFSQNFLMPNLFSYIPPGQCLMTTTQSEVVGTGAACASAGVQTITAGTNVTITGTGTNPIINASGGGSGSPTYILLSYNGNGSMYPLVASAIMNQPYGQTNGQPTYGTPPLGMVIGHVAVSCDAYNAADAAAGNVPYGPLDSNGLGGATINFAVTNATYSAASPLVLGSVVIPTSPQAGPYVVNGTSTVSSPYTVLGGDSVIIQVTGTSTVATQWLEGCNVEVGT